MPFFDPRRRCIFVHVPKTGGMAVTRTLALRPMPGLYPHAPLREVPATARAGMLTFGFVRNPWARQLSLYSYMCQRKRTSGLWYDKAAVRRDGFKAWLLGADEWTPEDRAMGYVGNAPPIQRRPQFWYLGDCEWVGRFERLQADFDVLCDRLRTPRRRLRSLNSSAHGSYQSAYDQEMMDAVAGWFAADIARWGYDF